MRCGYSECGAELDPARVARGAKYCPGNHCRAAAFRARHGYLPVSAGGPRPVASEARSNGSRSKPSGAQVSFHKAVDVLARYFADDLGWQGGERMIRAEARAVLFEALPERQRARVAK